MRKSLVLLAFSMCASPAFAQPAASQLPPELTDPATVDRLVDTMQVVSKAILDMKVGGVEAALQGRQASPAEQNMTVRELGHIDERGLDQQIAAARPQIEKSMKAVQRSLPEIDRSLAEARKSVERAIANMPDPNYPKR
jgi:hypothetical protein